MDPKSPKVSALGPFFRNKPLDKCVSSASIFQNSLKEIQDWMDLVMLQSRVSFVSFLGGGLENQSVSPFPLKTPHVVWVCLGRSQLRSKSVRPRYHLLFFKRKGSCTYQMIWR